MKSHIFKIISALISLIMLSGCDGNYEISGYIENTSNTCYEHNISQEEQKTNDETSYITDVSEIDITTELSEASVEEKIDNDTKETDDITQDEFDSEKSDEIFSFLDEEFSVNAKNVIFYDVNKDRILYSKNSDKIAFPASLTKIVTIMTALEYCVTDTEFRIGSEVLLAEEGSSLAYLGIGQRLSLGQLIYALLLPSGNDAAYSLGVNIARIVAEDMTLSDKAAADYFAELMNKFAKKIGAKNTNFANCDGFHKDNHYTTAEDLLLFAKKAMEYDEIMSVCGLPEANVTFLSGENALWYNSNRLIYSDNEYYLDYVTGMKTGFTDEAGYCFIGTTDKNGQKFIVVVLGCETIESRWDDVIKLFEAGYDYVGMN